MTMSDADAAQFVRGRGPFLRYLATQADVSRPASLATLIADAGGPERIAVVAVDVVNGFCKTGALASPRVGRIIGPIAALLRRAHEAGVPHVALVCDTHSPRAEEFHHFAPHCIAGSSEAEPVEELKALPWYDTYALVRKNSISPWHGEDDLAGWLRTRGLEGPGGLKTVIAAGDCTDLCLHQLALPLKLAANQDDRPLNVVVPRDCVQTYDLPVDAARALGAMPHDGDLLHEVFLYHLALNGITVAGEIVD